MINPDSGIVIRALSLDELALLGPLWEAAGLSYRPNGRDTLQNLRTQWLRDSQGFIGGFDRESLIGAVLATDDGRRGWINRLAVHPDYRGRGIGQLLIVAGEKVLRAKGLLILAALIEDDNIASREIFTKAGYDFLPQVLYYSKRESPGA
jgi:ribosomal protein S18 acetylase RimI-like enzyme